MLKRSEPRADNLPDTRLYFSCDIGPLAPLWFKMPMPLYLAKFQEELEDKGFLGSKDHKASTLWEIVGAMVGLSWYHKDFDFEHSHKDFDSFSDFGEYVLGELYDHEYGPDEFNELLPLMFSKLLGGNVEKSEVEDRANFSEATKATAS